MLPSVKKIRSRTCALCPKWVRTADGLAGQRVFTRRGRRVDNARTTKFGRSRSWRSARGAPRDQALTDVGVPGVDRHARIAIRALRSHAHASERAKRAGSLRL